MKAELAASTDTLREQINEALDQIELFTPEERKIHQKKMDKLKKELGHERFLTYLRKQAGLE